MVLRYKLSPGVYGLLTGAGACAGAFVGAYLVSGDVSGGTVTLGVIAGIVGGFWGQHQRKAYEAIGRNVPPPDDEPDNQA